MQGAKTAVDISQRARISSGGSLIVDAFADQKASAVAKGGQGGALAIGGAAANAGRNNPVSTTTGTSVDLTAADDVFITAFNGYEDNNFINILAVADNTAGGLVAAGAPRARVTVSDETTASLGQSNVVHVPRGDFDLQAITANFGIQSTANFGAGAAVATPKAEAFSTSNDVANATIGDFSQIDVGIDVVIQSSAGGSEQVNATTDAGGLERTRTPGLKPMA